MKFNPIQLKLFSSSGDLIKKLKCPYDVNWEEFEKTNDDSRRCLICRTPVLDTSQFDEGEIIALLKKKPETCIKISLDQNNIVITTNE